MRNHLKKKAKETWYNMKKYVVAHTHWDREWYFTTSDSLVLLDQVITDVIDTLQKDKNEKFCLDGQISIIDDYLSIHPDKLVDLQQLVKNGQLEVGPWYTQTDTFYVGGEAIVQNLYYGIKRTEELFSTYMKVLYLPDTFGFIHQMPMIARAFDLQHAIVWRGVDFDAMKIEPYFTWKGQDNSALQVATVHGGYGAFKKANASQLFQEKKLNPLLNEISERTKQQTLLMPIGNDQHNIDPSLQKTLEALGPDYIRSTYQEYFKTFDATVAPRYQGELRDVRYTRVHRTSGGVRMDAKQSAYHAEQQLTYINQPLYALTTQRGIQLSSHIIWQAWKKLFESYAHDGIVGCVSDAVAMDILNRNKQALELGKAQENLIKKMIALEEQAGPDDIFVYNLSLKHFSGYKTIEVISYDEEIECIGAKTTTIIETKKMKGYEHALVEKPEGNYYEKEPDYFIHTVVIDVEIAPLSFVKLRSKPAAHAVLKSGGAQIKNSNYRFYIENDTVHLETKTNVYQDVISIISDGNAGDTYDFSTTGIEGKHFSLVNYTVETSEHVQQMRLTYETLLPYTLEERYQDVSSKMMTVSLTLKLCGEEAPTVKIYVTNTVLNHRLRVGFKTVASDTSIASMPYGYIERPIVAEETIMNWQDRFVEKPVDIHPNSGVVGVKADKPSLWVVNQAMKEYQIVDDYIYLTLFSTTDELGKPDIAYRPGRASGDTTKKGHIRIETPLAQCLKTFSFNCLLLETENIDTALLEHEKLMHLPVFYQNQEINLFYERIDNKIDVVERKVDSKAYGIIPNIQANYIATVYSSITTNESCIRFYLLEDAADIEGLEQQYDICNVLEEKINVSVLEKYHLYVLKKKRDV